MKVRAIVFDLYGVLGLNGWQAFKLQHFADKPEAWENMRTLGQRVDAGEVRDSELVDAIAAETGESPETIRYQFEHTVPNVALLQSIATEFKPHYKIGLLSNASQDVFSEIFNAEEQGLFDVAISSFHVGLTKPDPAMFRLMAERMSVSPDECLMVDDQLRHVEAASTVGMRAVLYDSAEQCVADIRKALVDD